MTVEVHKYPVDVKSLRPSILSTLYGTSDKCNMRYDYEFCSFSSFGLLYVPAYFYREVGISAGQIVLPPYVSGMLP